MKVGASLAAELVAEAASTRRMLARVPWERAEWRPHAQSTTLGRLALHVAQLAGWPAGVVNDPGLDLASPAAAAMVPRLPPSTAELLTFFDRQLDAARAALQAAGDEDMAAIWTLRHGDCVIQAQPRAAIVRGVLGHAIHHRGQLSVYLRLLDVPVPGMYGPSADES